MVKLVWEPVWADVGAVRVYTVGMRGGNRRFLWGADVEDVEPSLNREFGSGGWRWLGEAPILDRRNPAIIGQRSRMLEK